MLSEFEAEARLIASRNLTLNVAAIHAKFDDNLGHLDVTYFLFDPPSADDEEFRELLVGELVAAFPEIRTASSKFGSLAELDAAQNHLIFVRN